MLQIREGIHIISFLFLNKNMCCGYSLKVPQQGASNEYPQHTFLWRNNKYINTFQLKKSALSGARLVSQKIKRVPSADVVTGNSRV